MSSIELKIELETKEDSCSIAKALVKKLREFIPCHVEDNYFTARMKESDYLSYFKGEIDENGFGVYEKKSAIIPHEWEGRIKDVIVIGASYLSLPKWGKCKCANFIEENRS